MDLLYQFFSFFISGNRCHNMFSVRGIVWMCDIIENWIYSAFIGWRLENNYGVHLSTAFHSIFVERITRLLVKLLFILLLDFTGWWSNRRLFKPRSFLCAEMGIEFTKFWLKSLSKETNLDSLTTKLIIGFGTENVYSSPFIDNYYILKWCPLESRVLAFSSQFSHNCHVIFAIICTKKCWEPKVQRD